jgi:hypothetical protein
VSRVFICPNGCQSPRSGWWSPGPDAARPPCSNCDAPLETDLLAMKIREAMEFPYTGMCYVASEAYYHLAGGRAAGLTPVWMPEPVASDEKHWAIRRADGSILDLTSEQYGELSPDYKSARGCGFLTKTPSKRTQAFLETMTAPLGRA